MSVYTKPSDHRVERVVANLKEAISRHGFGLLHEYDFKTTLQSKGFPFEHDCHVLEVCNPKQASEILSRDISVAMALPCRISVYECDGKTWVGMIQPSALLKLVSDCPDLMASAVVVEETLQNMIDEAI